MYNSGSKEGTGAMLKELVKRKPFVQKAFQPNGGGALSKFNLRPYGGRRWHEVPDEGENQISQSQHNFTNLAILRVKALRMTAFTLPEVLITLGIIGVVAALTLPSVITKYQDIVLINQTKRAFSQFQNVLALAAQDSGTPGDNSLTFPKDADSRTVTNNLAKYFNGVKVCNHSTQKGCSIYFYPISYGVPQYNNDGEAVYSKNNTQNKLISADGAIYSIDTNHTGCENTRYTGNLTNNAGEIIYNDDGTPKTYDYYSAICANIVMDVNGIKGPNQFGRDVYHFWVLQNKIDYNTGKIRGGDSMKNILSGKNELVYTKYKKGDKK